MSAVLAERETTLPDPVRWTGPSARTLEAVNELVTAPLYERQLWSWRAWWIAFAIGLAVTCFGQASCLCSPLAISCHAITDRRRRYDQ